MSRHDRVMFGVMTLRKCGVPVAWSFSMRRFQFRNLPTIVGGLRCLVHRLHMWVQRSYSTIADGCCSCPSSSTVKESNPSLPRTDSNSCKNWFTLYRYTSRALSVSCLVYDDDDYVLHGRANLCILGSTLFIATHTCTSHQATATQHARSEYACLKVRALTFLFGFQMFWQDDPYVTCDTIVCLFANNNRHACKLEWYLLFRLDKLMDDTRCASCNILAILQAIIIGLVCSEHHVPGLQLQHGIWL